MLKTRVLELGRLMSFDVKPLAFRGEKNSAHSVSQWAEIHVLVKDYCRDVQPYDLGHGNIRIVVWAISDHNRRAVGRFHD